MVLNTPIECIELLKNHFMEISSHEQYFDIYSFIGDDGMAIFYTNKSCDKYNDTIVKELAKLNEQVLLHNEGSLIAVHKTSYVHGNDFSCERNPASEYDKKLYKSFLKSRDSQSLVPYDFIHWSKSYVFKKH